MKTKKTEKENEPQLPQEKYETRDVDFKKLMFVGVGLIGLIVVTLAGAWLISSLLARHSDNPGAPPNVFASGAPNFPEPRLQSNPLLDLKQMRDHEDSMLSTYGWSDRKAGMVRVPIDVAMNLLLQQGLPVVPGQRKESERN
jgi:hypothetical protein